MTQKHKSKQAPSEYVSTLEGSLIQLGEQIPLTPTYDNVVKYVVIRDGLRVSDKDYQSIDDPRAISEQQFWKNVVSNYPDGTKVEIVQFDKKRHRIW